MWRKLLKTILSQRQEAIYYGMIVDATPDISHEEQNILLPRFISQDEETNKLQVSKRFMTCISVTGDVYKRQD